MALVQDPHTSFSVESATRSNIPPASSHREAFVHLVREPMGARRGLNLLPFHVGERVHAIRKPFNATSLEERRSERWISSFKG
jgi:hypothetical protein